MIHNVLLYQLQGRLDAVAAAMLLEAYFKRPEAALKITSVSS